ncbi:hypothetical protein K140096H11_05780 [Bacteroides intestinalis]
MKINLLVKIFTFCVQRYEKNAYFCSYQSNKSAYEQTIPTNWFNAYPTGSDKFRKLYFKVQL